MGEPYDFARLTTDADYNARLGAAYLRGLQTRFGTSIALVSSGYNAGPGRPARWLGDFGDLRRHADPVDWVELIPLDETRNYVMRVAESLPVYRARIMGKPAPIVPSFDLTGAVSCPCRRNRRSVSLFRRARRSRSARSWR
ncbi:transglycosylase SLT domain-containing protein [Paracoccus cavernae]|uniref:Transglycosylase SLT domain-containing protein n=1 Tax=Paracoccus cavernae TaxID=1571207 RepID=A0ABT8DA72_9RHOB|nr:transglycosylase SLT domain-containing protein [Paracoccus cavernae]